MEYADGHNEQWKTVKLGDLGNSFSGLSGKTIDDFGEGKPFIPYMNIFSNGRIDPNKLEYVRIADNEHQNRVEQGDWFFTTSSETPEEVGMTSVLVDDIGEAYLNSFCFGFRLYNKQEFDPEFVSYLFRSEELRKKISLFAQGSTRYNLPKQQMFDKLYFSYPESLPAQRRIAAILSSADKVIASTQKVIAKYKQMKQGMMEDLLKPKEGWKMVRLGEVGEINPSNKEPIPNQFIYIDLESVVAGKLLFENYILKGNAPSRAQRLVDKNDVLYQTVRPYQRNNYIHKKQGNYVASTGYALIRCYDDYEPDFIFYLLHAHNFESVVLGLCTGTSYPAIAPNNLKRIEIAIPFKNDKPDLIKQRRIAAILSGIDAKIAAEEKVLEKYEKVKKGLMERLLEENKKKQYTNLYASN